MYEASGRNRNYHVKAEDVKDLLPDWKGADGCIATNRITVEGCKVGYCYREEPDGGWDSGCLLYTSYIPAAGTVMGGRKGNPYPAFQTFITGIDTPFAEGGTALFRCSSLRFFFLSVSLSFALSLIHI